MKKILSTLLVLLSIITFSYAQSGLAGKIMSSQLNKAGDPNTGPTPDYSDLKYWSCSPFKKDAGDFLPEGVEAGSKEKRADVFFIHPTTYIYSTANVSGENLKKNPFKMLKVLKNAPWNADLSNTVLNYTTDTLSIENQATVFNESCRIFAPRYRQANLKAFAMKKGNKYATQAFDLAYADIKKAFEYYLAHHNEGRPIIIGGHSQGALHGIRLLQEFFDNKPLQQKLVCAYLAGYPVFPKDLKSIPPGSNPSQTGCVVSWQSFNPHVPIPKYIVVSRGNAIGVNPMTWTMSHHKASMELNSGTLNLYSGTLKNKKIILKNKISCYLDDKNFLQVEYDPELKNWLKNADNFHLWDFNLFWMNIRENVAQRTDAFLKVKDKTEKN